ncbi:alkyl/aryl-sulfatase [Psychrilyobacter atlanticus]|uniref:alkyl/aryl-sulfatase n=1 Tax=Psychrilyobacter atlanticus TaxID=271091 RepID=UPI0003FE935E|nr:alkyl sulfatase dimerization domain-containing protein [Psychrilyobacter atlanticus]
MKKIKFALLALMLVSAAGCNNLNMGKNTQNTAEVPNNHFDAKGKPASTFTVAKWEEQKNILPFEDKRDFEDQQKGFIAAPDYREIKDKDGNVVWSMGSYDFLLKEGEEYNTIHPSLQRQAILNMNYGLYKVRDGVYQIRGFDLANITFIKGKTGWIVFDPLTSPETSSAALKFINEQLGERPVVAVVYSHCHADHFGGARGVIDDKDVASGKVKVIAPEGFMEHAISENLASGNAMNRRLYFQYGVLLPADPHGHVDQSIGKNVSKGQVGLLAPNVIISKDIEKMTIDGVKMVFQNTPGTEAPAEMNTYFPDLKTFWAAENVTATIHNIYTLRGALVRDSLLWSKEIDKALYMFGQDADYMMASHSWPRFGNDRIQEVMRDQRDTYANLNNGVLNLANKGVTINEIHNEYEVPESLQNKWHARSYHGSVQHNSRAVINRYLGYWDANPATLIPLSPGDSAPLYVEMMGGSRKIIKKGQELYDKGEYKLAQEILNKLVYAEPENQAAKDLLADVFEQIGYQQESPSVRNSFLEGASELRNGVPTGNSADTTGPDFIKGMDTGSWLDFLSIRLNSDKIGDTKFIANLKTPDNKEEYIVELNNSTLTNIKGFQHKNPDLTITVNRSDLNSVMMGQKTITQLLEEGAAKSTGDTSVIKKLEDSLDTFDKGFEILPGTKG